MSSQIRSSESIANLATALAAAQAEYKVVVKNCKNDHFKNKYADLSSIIDATRDALSKQGLCFVQCPTLTEGRVSALSRLMHKTGEWLEFDLSLKPGQDTPQAFGSAITYGRRYGLAALLGVSDADDDDGNAAQPDSGKMPAHQERLKELGQEIAQKTLQINEAMQTCSAYASALKDLRTNVERMVRFEIKYGVTHKQLAAFCDGRSVDSWNEEDAKKLTAAGVAMKAGAEWDSIVELAADEYRDSGPVPADISQI